MEPKVRELLTTTDVAEVLGVSRSRVRQLANGRPDFPKPYAISRGPVRPIGTRLWSRDDIDYWNVSADRTPGRRWSA
jgi:predicted DNA-binding transcriptional regulator AlpA